MNTQQLQPVRLPQCIHCTTPPAVVQLDPDKVRRWAQGEHIQNVWPLKTADERELMMTGTHQACWDAMWATEDDEEV